jgi:hypothetical protein
MSDSEEQQPEVAQADEEPKEEEKPKEVIGKLAPSFVRSKLAVKKGSPPPPRVLNMPARDHVVDRLYYATTLDLPTKV